MSRLFIHTSNTYSSFIPEPVLLEILREASKGKTPSKEHKSIDVFRLVCKQWNDLHVQLLPTSEIGRRISRLPKVSKYRILLSDIASKRLYHINEIVKVSKELQRQEKLIGEDGAREKDPAIADNSSNITQSLIEKLNKLNESPNINLPTTAPDLYSSDQTQMLVDLIKIRRFDLIALAIVCRIPFDTKTVIDDLQSATLTQHFIRDDLISFVFSVHQLVCMGLMIKMHCAPKDIFHFSLKNISLNGFFRTQNIQFPFLIRDLKFSDLLEYELKPNVIKNEAFAWKFLKYTMSQMFGEETIGEMGDQPANTPYQDYIKIIPPGSLWTELDLSPYHCPDLKAYLRTQPCRREEYKEIVVDFLRVVNFDTITTTARFKSSTLGAHRQAEFLAFLDECIEEYRGID